MLKFRELEHFDDFGTEAVYWVDVSGVPEKLIQEAKNIDSDNYSEDCLGVCFYYDKGTEKFTAVMEVLLFACVVSCFSVLSVIIIGIWVDTHPAQEPADAKLLLMLVDKLVLV